MSSILVSTVAILALTGAVTAILGIVVQQEFFINVGIVLLLASLMGSFVGLLGAVVTLYKRDGIS